MKNDDDAANSIVLPNYVPKVQIMSFMSIMEEVLDSGTGILILTFGCVATRNLWTDARAHGPPRSVVSIRS